MIIYFVKRDTYTSERAATTNFDVFPLVTHIDDEEKERTLKKSQNENQIKSISRNYRDKYIYISPLVSV